MAFWWDNFAITCFYYEMVVAEFACLNRFRFFSYLTQCMFFM